MKGRCASSLFTWGGAIDFELEVVDRDSSVGVNGSGHSEAEDIFWGLIRDFDGKFSEEVSFLFEGFLESEKGDFLISGVDLLMIIG